MTAGCVCAKPLINVSADLEKAVCVNCGKFYLGDIESVLENSAEVKTEVLREYERRLLGQDGQKKFQKKVTNLTPKKKKRK